MISRDAQQLHKKQRTADETQTQGHETKRAFGLEPVPHVVAAEYHDDQAGCERVHRDDPHRRHDPVSSRGRLVVPGAAERMKNAERGPSAILEVLHGRASGRQVDSYRARVVRPADVECELTRWLSRRQIDLASKIQLAHDVMRA